MAKNRSGSSVQGMPRVKSVRHIPDSEIDFSDIPKSTKEELSRARRVGCPSTGKAKDLIAIRVDPNLLAALRKLANRRRKPYQTLMHELLEQAVKNVA